ncbi:MAG TPA: NAD(P)H-binding protein [Gemmatimonadaceae bacterium]|nr:NAD(P)H-binding protein [Gemmatimonadaceae bacterium]
MNAIIFGATGMVGQGVLRECLLDQEILHVLSIVRAPSGRQHPKLRELVHANFFDFSEIESELAGFDAAFFCLGVTSAGKTEAQYSRVTYDITMAVAEPLARLNPDMTFIFVSGAGTDSTERGRSMWARVKGKTENALLRLPFKAAYMFRPGVIQPMHGVKSKTALYRIPYLILRPLTPWLRKRFPQYVTTTEQLGRAMIVVAKYGAPKSVLESSDINKL